MTDPGREERFTNLVQAHADAVYRYLRRRHPSGDVVGTEDLLSETMAVAWRRLDDVPKDAELAWLYGVARKQLANSRRRNERRSNPRVQVRTASSHASAEDEVIAGLTVQEALDGLSTTEREVILLTAWEGLSPTELAVALHISVNAAGVRLSKARSHFRALLQALTESSAPEATHTPV